MDTADRRHDDRDDRDDASIRSATDPRAAMPRWVKVFAVVLAILVLLAVAMFLIGGGEHGPGRHTTSGGEAREARTVSVPVNDRPRPRTLSAVSQP